MIRKSTALLAPLALFAIAAAPNWLSTVRQNADGAYVLGNPAAKAKLTEYLSYTCSHCAQFVGQSAKPIKAGYVARGTVSIEVRNAVRDRYDFAASLLARCGGPAKFFGNSDAIMAAQPVWIAKIEAFEATSAEKLQGLSITDSLKIMARGIGLDAVMKARGFTPVQIDACLASRADQEKVIGMTNEAWDTRKINGTPSFLINNAVVSNAGSWALLEPKLKAAIAAR